MACLSWNTVSRAGDTATSQNIVGISKPRIHRKVFDFKPLARYDQDTMNHLNSRLYDGIRKVGFRKWYERELLSSHAHMVLAFLHYRHDGRL
jgi:hypothetical protein